MKKEIARLLSKEIGLAKEQIENLIEIPPNNDLGDYAFPCFILSKELKKSPQIIAQDLAAKIQKKLPKDFRKVHSAGPYLNFFINNSILAEETINKILKEKTNYGRGKFKQLKVVLEFPSPNTNKPLHLGHLRNMAIGESVARTREFLGDKVKRVNLNNDRGVHICKSMLAYQKWPNAVVTKNKKSDHIVGDYYILFAKKLKDNPNLEQETQEMLQKWESGDKRVHKIWKTMNKWALDGFKQTYRTFGIKHDKEYFESRIFEKAKTIVEEGLKNKVFERKDDGAVVIDLNRENLGEKVVLRADGTSIYITQDMYLAKLKSHDFKPDESIILSGNEQNYHFSVLFLILKKLGYKFADSSKHLSYGMVFLPEGKMKSREGTVVDADNLINEVKEMVKSRIMEQRQKISEKELEHRSLAVSLAAIKYWLLKVEMRKDITFNPKESISFEGDTGPYLLYTYARASSILRKIKTKPKKSKISDLNEYELNLIKMMSEFPEIVQHAYNNSDPADIAHYAHDLAQTFNEFYHSCPVIGSLEKEPFRIKLIESFRYVIKNSLYILGIDTIEEM
jgi:arginyl-tRNA synthetase